MDPHTKFAKLVTDMSLHESSKFTGFPGCSWTTNRYRVVDEDGRDLLITWPQFRKRAIEAAEAMGYAIIGEEQAGDSRVAFRRVNTVEQAIAVKRAAWLEGRECTIEELPGGWGTWEIY